MGNVSYFEIVKYIIGTLMTCSLIYNEYRNELLIDKYDKKVHENKTLSKEKEFEYPPLPAHYPTKKVMTPPYDIPLILVGGHPRSGTTLMRSMLDAHDLIRCGEETHIIPTVASIWDDSFWSDKSKRQYENDGFSQDVRDRAVANFLMVVIVEHGQMAHRLCNKDPFTMNHGVYINRLFPNSKFIFMVRDGRATVHSAITRNVGIGGLDLRSYEKSLLGWNFYLMKMYRECETLGPQRCHPVYYEQLILEPRNVMKGVLKFLELPWRGEVLKHEDFVDKDGGISLNPLEPSTNQVTKARYLEALTSWVGKIPAHLLEDMDRVAPMLSVLGYDPLANPPRYDQLQYRWGQNIKPGPRRTPYRRFISALYSKANDTAVKKS